MMTAVTVTMSLNTTQIKHLCSLIDRICVEINFPTLLIEHERLGIHCLLLSSYPVDKIFHTKACAYAAIHNYWISLSVPTECVNLMRTGLTGLHGIRANKVQADQGVVVANLGLF